MPKVGFALRIDDAVMDAVRRSAAADMRSANAQVELLLREALKARGTCLPAPGNTRGIETDSDR